MSCDCFFVGKFVNTCVLLKYKLFKWYKQVWCLVINPGTVVLYHLISGKLKHLPITVKSFIFVGMEFHGFLKEKKVLESI